MRLLVSLLFPLFVLPACEPAPKLQRSAQHPNIIFIMSDDNGAETIGAYGGLDYATPNIDRLAKQGTMFLNGHSLSVCVQTRQQLMRGQFAFRKAGKLKPTEMVLPKALQQAGYDTFAVGKWHLGRAHSDDLDLSRHQKIKGGNAGATPLQAGFNNAYIVHHGDTRYYGTSITHHSVQSGEKTKTYSEKTFSPDTINKKLLEFLDKHKTTSTPFFVYYPLNLPHAPHINVPNLLPTESKFIKHRRMIEYADVLVGRVVKKLQDTGLDKNTIIIYTADNGTISKILSRQKDSTGKTRFVQGGKATTLKTGTNVPLVVWSPLFAQNAGSKREELLSFRDFYPTILDFANVPPPPLPARRNELCPFA